MAENLDELILKCEQVANNKAKRALICLCVDSSFSMSKEGRIDTVNKEIEKFLQTMNNNKSARDGVEICLVSFGHNVDVKCKFGPITDAIAANREIKPDGSRTEMGAGVKKTLELLDEELELLKVSGSNNYYKPWLIIISDGEATDMSLCNEVSEEVKARIRDNKLKVKCMNFGNATETEALRKFTIDGEVEQINNIQAMEFFDMLSRSISEVSQRSIQTGEF